MSSELGLWLYAVGETEKLGNPAISSTVPLKATPNRLVTRGV